MLAEFEARLATEAACRAYLAQLRWPDGFRCPARDGTTAWPVRAVLWQCAGVGARRRSPRGRCSRTTRTPLTAWFRAIWWVTNSKAETSALTLQRLLGLFSASSNKPSPPRRPPTPV